MYTPANVYWSAILSSIIELGGSARGDEVVGRVGKKLENVLTTADREMIPSGVQVRWQNRIQWQRFNMVRQGLLRNDSPWGICEITEEGRRWIARVADRVRGAQA